jgi:hypothetical protein
MSKRCFFTIADSQNLKYYETLKKSLSKVTDDKLILIDEEKIKQLGDPHFYYRATPIIAKALMKTYDMVCKLDADQLILGDLSHIWKDTDFDAAVVKNSNPKEDEAYPIRLLDIHPHSYVNCGFVVLKSKAFVQHWLDLCMSPHFNNFQYREQDLLNIMVYYMSNEFGPYKVKHLDDSNKWHGLVWKGYEPLVTHKGGKFMLPKGDWNKEDKEVVCWHVAGGNAPNKMNYRTKFQDNVVKEIDKLLV